MPRHRIRWRWASSPGSIGTLDGAVVCTKRLGEACGKDFKKVLSGRGQRCLVVHHKKQLSMYDQPRETKASELAVVCANYHMRSVTSV